MPALGKLFLSIRGILYMCGLLSRANLLKIIIGVAEMDVALVNGNLVRISKDGRHFFKRSSLGIWKGEPHDDATDGSRDDEAEVELPKSQHLLVACDCLLRTFHPIFSNAVGAACSHMMFIKEIMLTPADIPFARRCVGQISEM